VSDKAIQEWTSAIVAVLAVLGAFGIVFYELLRGESTTVPDFVSLLIGAVVGSYLTRVASVNGARQAGTSAAQTAIAANLAAGSGKPS
jgi:uncharacterized protein (TIGR02588 family)